MNIEETLAKLTDEEKIKLLAGASMWETEPIERLGIPALVLTDGPHGLRLSQVGLENPEPATAFPVEAAMAAAWNPSLLEEAGRAMAEECRHYGVSVLLGPGVNGKRSPLGGRNFEYFSEDPFLGGTMGTAWVRGLQSGGVGASLKHFVANEQEKNRMVVNSLLDERTLREIYLRPFEMVVRDARPWTVMCSYNGVNGTRMSENDRLLNGVLKEEWGYDGLVMSDWGAVVDKVASVKNGLDLEMPGPGLRNGEVLEALQKGEITPECLDDHVRRFLRLAERVGEGGQDIPEIDFEAHDEIACRLAEESLVLLKNENDILPLPRGGRVAVIGEFARRPRIQGGGSSKMNPARLSVPVDEMAAFADVVHADGCRDGKRDDKLLAAAVETAGDADCVVVFVGTTEEIESEGYDRKDLSLPPAHLELLREVSGANPRVVAVNMSGSAVDLKPVDIIADAILQAWLPGQAAGRAIARVLFGRADPSGRLSETIPFLLEHSSSYLSFPGTVDRVYYDEGVFVGYRHYDTRRHPVLFPFGFGLSYGRFVYSELRVERIGGKGSPEFRVRVDVENTGERHGKEVVQLYVRDPESSERRPLRELKAFAKVDLEPGESETVTFEIGEDAFSWYVTHLGRFAVESGDFVLEVGASSRDIRLTETVSVVSADEVRPPLTERHDLREHIEDERNGGKVKAVYERIAASTENGDMLPLLLGMPLDRAMRFLPVIGASEEDLKALREAVAGSSGKTPRP